MYSKIHVKNQDFLDKLLSDNYCVSRIEKDNELLYIVVEVNKRNIIIDYDAEIGFYEFGDIYKYVDKDAHTVLYAYGIRQYETGVIEKYLDAVIDYDAEIGFYEFGDIYKYVDKDAHTVLYAYGIRQYETGVIEKYLDAVPPDEEENDGWCISKITDKEALMSWVKENKFTIKKLQTTQIYTC